MGKVSPADDAKLQHLKEHILDKIDSPINPGNRKVLALYGLCRYRRLPVRASRARCFSSGTASTPPASSAPTGPSPRSARKADFQELLTLFSPQSKEKALLLPDVQDEIDLLIATDCISEGQNLQDCDYLINYDIHWNPVRIIQRFGRIDRIGSKNASIQLVNYWPDISLDEYIRLKERVESRMVIADVTATGDENPLDGRSNDLAYRKEQLRRLQEEVIELEDLKAGVSITDLGLNDFRMDLLELRQEPMANSRGCPAVCTRYCPQIRSAVWSPASSLLSAIAMRASTCSQLNRLHPYYLVYVDMDGQTIMPHTEVKRLLDLVRSVAKPCETPILDGLPAVQRSAPTTAVRWASTPICSPPRFDPSSK